VKAICVSREALVRIPVWLSESHELPLVQVNLLVLAGSGDDPPGRFGLPA
jgi:hypothetical protein